MKVYRQHRVWTDMYELSVTLESVLHVWSSDAEEQLLEAHRVTVGESERFKAVLGADFTVQYIRRSRGVNLIRVTLSETDKAVAGIVPAIDQERPC